MVLALDLPHCAILLHSKSIMSPPIPRKQCVVHVVIAKSMLVCALQRCKLHAMLKTHFLGPRQVHILRAETAKKKQLQRCAMNNVNNSSGNCCVCD